MWSDTGPIALKTVRRVRFRGDDTLSVVGYDSVEFPHLPTNRRRREGDPYVTFLLLVKVIDAKSVPGYESSPARAFFGLSGLLTFRPNLGGFFSCVNTHTRTSLKPNERSFRGPLVGWFR
jgi:hypothetical protein